MTELEAILLLLITIGNIILFIVLCLGYIIKKKQENVVFEYEKLITSYKKTLEVMDANITHLRKVAHKNKENVECNNDTESKDAINTENIENTETTEKDK